MLIAPLVQHLHLRRQTDHDPQLLKPEIGAGQVCAPLPAVGRLDQRFQHVKRNALDAIAQQKLLLAREPLDCQSASNRDPLSARKSDPGDRRGRVAGGLIYIKAPKMFPGMVVAHWFRVR